MNDFNETPEEKQYKFEEENNKVFTKKVLYLTNFIVGILFSIIIYFKLKNKLPDFNWVWYLDKILFFLCVLILVFILMKLLKDVIEILIPIFLIFALGYFIYWDFNEEKIENKFDRKTIENVIDAIDPRIENQQNKIEFINTKILILEQKLERLEILDSIKNDSY